MRTLRIGFRAENGRGQTRRKGKRRKTMLNTLLSVIRAILVELVDQLLRKVCTLG